jgi:hypothetical protein
VPATILFVKIGQHLINQGSQTTRERPEKTEINQEVGIAEKIQLKSGSFFAKSIKLREILKICGTFCSLKRI